MHKAVVGIALGIFTLMLISACRKTDDPPVGPDNGDGIPAGMSRIAGNVTDANGDPLANALLHVVYEFDAPRADGRHLDTPSSTGFLNDARLFTECGGTTPLPDGVILKIFWDRNGNGVDAADEPPPLCDNPPDCESGPALTVNFNEFPMNGVDLAGSEWAGYFNTDRYFTTVGDVLTPNRYYVRIYCADGNVLYTSQVVDVPPGPSETILTFDCTPCAGAPVVPAWTLEQPYPNPARDSVTVRYGLERAANASLSLWTSAGLQLATWLNEFHGAGAGGIRRGLDELPNGLYEVRMAADAYTNRRLFLRNETDYNRLRGAVPAAGSAATGEFSFLTAAGVSIDRRGSQGEQLGAVMLERITVAALKVGYQIADTTFTVGSEQQYTLNLILRPQ